MVLSHPKLLFQLTSVKRIVLGIKLLLRGKQPKKKKESDRPKIRDFSILSIATIPEKQGLGIGKLLIKRGGKDCATKSVSKNHFDCT